MCLCLDHTVIAREWFCRWQRLSLFMSIFWRSYFSLLSSGMYEAQTWHIHWTRYWH